MLDRKNDTLYLIVFLIIAMLIGFTGAYFLEVAGIVAYLLIATVFTLLVYSIMLFLYRNYKKRTMYRTYRSYLARGSYQEIANSIDSDSKEMDDVWEFKLLALFHSGNTKEFMRLYRNYMNEINECATLERFQISILHDILLAVESPNKPVSFLKNTENTKYKYTKSIEYQLYYNIYMGLKEYYQPQRNLVKVYFEKFLQQSEDISKPLSFYLYYLMTLTMMEGNHPLCEPYRNRTQSFIYDDNSLQLVNTHIHQRMTSMQKGSGNQDTMDRQRDDRNFLNDMDTNSSFDKSFNMEETGFRTMPQAEEGFVKKRHASEFQSDFDALNASVQNNNTFNLYEDNDFDEISPRQQRAQRSTQQPLPVQEEEVDVDLDPTWFARSTIRDDEPMVTANFSMRNPRMQETTQQVQRQDTLNPAYRSNQIQQDTFMNANTYQDLPVTPTYPTNAPQTQQSEPAFMNSRTYMDNNQQQELHPQASRVRQNDMQTRSSMMNPNMQNQAMQQASQPQMQQRFPNQVNAQAPQNNMNQQLGQTSQMQRQRMQNATMMQQNVVNTPQDRFSRFQQDSAPRPTMDDMPQRNAPISTPVNGTTDKKKLTRKEKKNAKQDPFGFDNPNALGKDPFSHEASQVPTQMPRKEQVRQQPRVSQMDTTPTNSYRHFVKRNLSIAGMTLINAVVVSIASSSFVYTQFFNKYPINSNMILEIVFLASLVALLMTYLIAGIHTGWTILKKPLASWSMVAKCLTSPFLLVASLLIGTVSEIPYLIYASIKANNEKAIQ